METYKKDVESGLRLILRYGIMNYAIKLKYDLQDAAKQICYYYYRKQDVLQTSILKKIAKAIDNELFTIDEDYNGFSGRTFQPDDNIAEIIKLFDSDPQFKADAILHYQLHLCTSDDHLGIGIASNDSLIKSYNTALQIKKNFETMFGQDAMPNCKKSILFKFIENPKDIDLFRAYIGILSLIGQRTFISTSKPVVISRMIGCKSKAVFDFYKTDKNLSPTIGKYGKRYHMSKLLDTLENRKFILYFSHQHESILYVSKYSDDPKKVADLIKENRELNGMKKRKKEALQHLYNTT
jgi:hypothetical protein